jgi:hypothetical protein
MTAGRPTNYTPELIAAAWEYARGGWIAAGDPVPTVAALACEIGISRDTCYEWAKHEDKEFSDILSKIAQEQERNLVKGGLGGDFNAAITKMMMTKHGYSDRVENDHTSSDGSMTPKGVPDDVITALDAIAGKIASSDGAG